MRQLRKYLILLPWLLLSMPAVGQATLRPQLAIDGTDTAYYYTERQQDELIRNHINWLYDKKELSALGDSVARLQSKLFHRQQEVWAIYEQLEGCRRRITEQDTVIAQLNGELTGAARELGQVRDQAHQQQKRQRRRTGWAYGVTILTVLISLFAP